MPLSATPPALPPPSSALGRSCPPALIRHAPTLVKTPLMRRTKYLTSNQPARATSTISRILHSRPHPIPCVLPAAACLPVSDWCCHGNGRVEVSILLLAAQLILLPAVCFMCCVAEYLLSHCAVACVLLRHARDQPMEPKLCLD